MLQTPENNALVEQNHLANLIAKLFIARRDVKAVQSPDGAYRPHISSPGVYLPWTRNALVEHLFKSRTYGHYLLDTDNTCKLFAFDIDLDKTGKLPTLDWAGVQDDADAQDWTASFEPDLNPREAWLNRRDPARGWLKYCMKNLASQLYNETQKLGIPAAVAYTGCKGLHVYGFTGRIPALMVRKAMNLILENLKMQPVRGNVFFKHPSMDLNVLTVEAFPKQDQLSNSDGFGNLMRLPLGRNLKTSDPTFFLDMDNTIMSELTPASPLDTLIQVEAAL